MSETPIEPGQTAPELNLVDQDGARVKLADLAGSWVVLYFYPKDDTPGCTTEACEFTDSIEDFASLDAVVLGCSPDPPERHQRFIAKHELKLRLLSDPEHRVMEAYGAWGEKKMYGRTSMGVIRSTVILDPEGRVAHHWRRVRAAGHAAKVQETLEKLRQTR
jgi:peroxiredoxin Q/BCP